MARRLTGLAVAEQDTGATEKTRAGKHDTRLDVRAPSSCEPDRMRSVTVVAQVQTGAILDAEWPVLLDGLLAAVARRRRLGADYNNPDDNEIEALPLARWTRDTANEWVWLASTAMPDRTDVEDVRWFHQRFDHKSAEKVLGDKLPKNIRQIGPTKDWRLPNIVTVCSTLTWWAVGDPDQIRQMVQAVPSVGRKRGQGEGAVVRWAVEDAGAPDPAWALRAPDGTVSRPVPAHAAAALGAPLDAETTESAVRPPYWRPPPKDDVEGPDVPRVWRTVLAPDTEVSP